MTGGAGRRRKVSGVEVAGVARWGPEAHIALGQAGGGPGPVVHHATCSYLEVCGQTYAGMWKQKPPFLENIRSREELSLNPTSILLKWLSPLHF